MNKADWRKYIAIAAVLSVAILFVARFGGLSILRLYVESGVGTCKKIPILCMTPQEGTVSSDASKEYFKETVSRKFPTLELVVPRGFDVVQETMKRVSYKKKGGRRSGVIYLLYEPPDFFVNLFPQLKKQGISGNYEFIKRIMYTRLDDIHGLTDAFFMIMKGIFTPDLGRQENLKMVQFRIADKSGFINYNLSGSNNYFDCNVITDAGDFFKIYVKDTGARLNLEQVLAIVSSVTKTE